jgi:Ser/Thr protein kinase RdoA (MazF antagonist)
MTFDELTPDSMLPAIEDYSGFLLTGYTAPFSSYINRVYELRTKDGIRIVVKFYRPDRWSRDAILDEHKFMLDCQENEIPVVTPILLKDQSTLGTFNGLNFALFPKKAGRQLEINDFEDWVRLGSLIARIHSVGAKTKANSRVVIDPRITTLSDCKHLCDNVIPGKYREQYRSLCMQLIDQASPSFETTERIRIHGDLHTGNILSRMDEGLLVIDFDDMAMGPPVQDLWLLLPERADKAAAEVELFLEGYEQFRTFDRKSLRCIEFLRAMRMIYFLSWCSRQMADYQFKKNFPEWGSDTFWQREIADLSDQINYCGDALPDSFNC